MKRFVCRDSTLLLTNEFDNSARYNLYAYCEDDPVNGIDDSGCATTDNGLWDDVPQLLFGGIVIISAFYTGGSSGSMALAFAEGESAACGTAGTVAATSKAIIVGHEAVTVGSIGFGGVILGASSNKDIPKLDNEYQRSVNSNHIHRIYKSIKDSPNYPDGFEARKNGLTQNKVNNSDLLEELRKVENGSWRKIYKDGYDSYGNRISIHYFQSESGKVFNVKVKPGWSN